MKKTTYKQTGMGVHKFTNYKTMDPRHVERLLRDAWLNLDVSEDDIYNPLEVIPRAYEEEPHLFLTWIMSNPYYLSMFCKEILNVAVFPTQALMLQELWTHKFPILLGSRGLSKCVSGDTNIITNKGFIRIRDLVGSITPGERIHKDVKILGENGFTDLDYCWNNGLTKTKKINTRHGYSIEGTFDHPLRVVSDGKIIWKELQDIKEKDYIVIDRKSEWHEADDESITEDVAYKCGLNLDLPEWVWRVSKEKTASLISGIFDSNSVVRKIGEIVLSSYSNNIIKNVQILLLKFGIISSIRKKLDRKNNCDYYRLKIFGENLNKFQESIGFRINSKRDRLRHLCNNIKTVDLPDLPDYLIKNTDYFYDIVSTIEDSECVTYDVHLKTDHSFISNGFISHNTFTLSLYALLRAILLPGRKIVCVGAAFRQSKILFEYMEQMWRNAPILRDMIGQGKRDDQIIKHDSALWSFLIGDSRVHASPLGDGSTIRGMRANDTLVEEFACLERNTIIQTDIGLVKIKDYFNNSITDLLNKDNKFERPDKFYQTPFTDVYKITTQNGYSFKCSSIHQVWTSEGWKLAKDLTKDDWLEMDTNDYFPSRYISKDGTTINEDMGWLLGLLISEGTNTVRGLISVTNTSEKLIDEVKSRLNMDWKVHTKEEYMDKRGWKCRKCYNIYTNNVKVRETLSELGMGYVTSHKKEIPWCILQSPRSVVIEFLKGLYAGDGTGYRYTEKGRKRVGIAYYSVSEELVNQLQILLLKFGITCTKGIKNNKLSKNPQWMLTCRGDNAAKLFELLNLEKWEELLKDAKYLIRKPSITEKNGKYIFESYRLNKHVYLGSFDNLEDGHKAFEDFWKQAKPAFRVKFVEKLPEQDVLYDFHMPETHSFIGNGFIQHNSINRHIFENVVAGFGIVSANPVDNMKRQAEKAMREQLGMEPEVEDIRVESQANQTILSGTAYYQFNHFYEYFKKYRDIIRSKGDVTKLQEIVGDEALNKDFNWKDYCIIRIPYDLTQAGYFDPAQLSRNRINTLPSNFLAEYGACFPADSDGFFKRSMIERCTPSDKNTIMIGDEKVDFITRLSGNPHSRYIYAIDPASEQDNFAIVILELFETHKRIVYCWTTNKKKHRKQITHNKTTEHNYWAFCVKKVRHLMQLFPCAGIAIDSQGGGNALREAFADSDKLGKGEVQIWPVINPGKPEYSDTQEGLHIITMCNFASNEWLSNAYFNTKKDFEEQILIFPSFDGATLGLSQQDLSDEDSFLEGGILDTLENIILEIEELKTELTCIMHTKSTSGRDQFTVPDMTSVDGKKTRVKKDRATALIMANSLARTIQRDTHKFEYEGPKPNENQNLLYVNNPYFNKALSDAYSIY